MKTAYVGFSPLTGGPKECYSQSEYNSMHPKLQDQLIKMVDCKTYEDYQNEAATSAFNAGQMYGELMKKNEFIEELVDQLARALNPLSKIPPNPDGYDMCLSFNQGQISIYHSDIDAAREAMNAFRRYKYPNVQGHRVEAPEAVPGLPVQVRDTES